MALAEALKGNTTLTSLRSAALPSRTHPPVRHGPTACTLAALALFTLLLPFAQPHGEQPRPRGWHGARRGAQGQHDPQDALVCCPAISNPPAHASRPQQHARSLHSPFSPSFRRLRSLFGNKLGPAAGMAFAEALKGNTTLMTLGSAALPSNPLARASRALDIHPSF
eukprot:scaffold45752_cov56-Phaeocystis_antarctica.AAC.1